MSRKNVIRNLFFSATATLLLDSTCIAAAGLEILYPVDKKIYHEAYASITVKLHDRNISKVVIITDSNERYPLELTKECDDVCSKTLKLRLGENGIRVWGYKGEKLAYEVKSELYFVSQIDKGFTHPPVTYREHSFHTDENEKICADCHDMSVNERGGTAFMNVEESNCYVCHKNITAGKYAHAPAVNWLCSSCHGGKSADQNKKLTGQPKYRVSDPVASACYRCHDKNKQRWDAKKYKHLPVDAGRCVKCHDPHASDTVMFVREVPNVLCLKCHGDKKLSSQMRGNSKCPGTEAETCTRCHNPHASYHYFFLDTARTHTADPDVNIR